MWIIKAITGTICFALCLIGAILWIIPSILMWNLTATNHYFVGVWSVYDNMFKNYDYSTKRNTTTD